MDIDNGMQSNVSSLVLHMIASSEICLVVRTVLLFDCFSPGQIYDSMAAGVTNALCVVCFMSAEYEGSENCRLELQFAKQTCRPIIPAIMTKGYAASGWLGIVTAGSLWVPLFQNINNGIEQLAHQIRLIAPAVEEETTDEISAQSGTVSANTGLFSLDEMRGELLRLQAEIDSSTSKPVADLQGGACRLPAGVPDPPAGLRISSEMKELLEALVTKSSGPSKVGFWGQGGVGKTTVSAWLVRQDAVRNLFSQVGWCPLGQSPNIPKSQEMLYLQLTGTELSSEIEPEERHEKLRQAMAGKNVLLVLDDLWNPEHARALTFLDDATNSKVLVSSRVRTVLEGSHIVAVGVPSEEEAVQMLLATAAIDSDAAPPEAYDIVEFCNRLPLAVGIAGRMLKDMALGDDWSGVLAMMKEEFDQAHSVEETVSQDIFSFFSSTVPCILDQFLCWKRHVRWLTAGDRHQPSRYRRPAAWEHPDSVPLLCSSSRGLRMPTRCAHDAL